MKGIQKSQCNVVENLFSGNISLFKLLQDSYSPSHILLNNFLQHNETIQASNCIIQCFHTSSLERLQGFKIVIDVSQIMTVITAS